MGNASSEIKEIRFVIEKELTQAYVLVNAIGDCPTGVQGWHHKTFPALRSVLDITENEVKNYLDWSLESPKN